FPVGEHETSDPWGAEFLPDGNLLFAYSIDLGYCYTLKFVELSSGREFFRIESIAVPAPNSADGRTLVTYSPRARDPGCEVWDIGNRKRIAVLESGPPVALSADGATLLCHTDGRLDFGRTVREFSIWDINRRCELGR